MTSHQFHHLPMESVDKYPVIRAQFQTNHYWDICVLSLCSISGSTGETQPWLWLGFKGHEPYPIERVSASWMTKTVCVPMLCAWGSKFATAGRLHLANCDAKFTFPNSWSSSSRKRVSSRKTSSSSSSICSAGTTGGPLVACNRFDGGKLVATPFLLLGSMLCACGSRDD